MQHQTRGKPIDQIPLQQENNPDAIENVPMEQDSSNSSICFDPEEYLENLGGKIDELKQVESGTRRFSDISQKLTKDDPRRYFDIICQVI